ncbi:unnamed protein product [Symbiodinium sp. CCMP2456]|nr:unnamed protein product [Symbiodinium sp. CCMP2456]
MHNIDLAVIPDLAISLLLDWTDNKDYVAGQYRPTRLRALYDSYNNFIGRELDRADPRLFSAEVLKPNSNKFINVSQHYLSAAAARGLLVWLAKVSQDFAAASPTRDNHWRAGVCLGLLKLQQIAMEHGRVLPEEQRELSVEYYMWHLRPKIHHVEHVVMDHVAFGRLARVIRVLENE